MYSPPGTSQYNATATTQPATTYASSQQYNSYNQFIGKPDQVQNPKSKCKYNRCETIVKPLEDFRSYPQQQEGLGSMVECYRENDCNRMPAQIARQVTPEQPDYTQVSPAKLALRRHLSQEKLAAQHHTFNHNESIVATRTIGDLVSGEIERTLEISNQSIINAAVDMSDIQGTATLTSRSVVNANIPPRPERVNVKVPNTSEVPVPNTAKETEPIVRQVYSPISRPSSAEGLEGLAYVHNHPKSNTHSHSLHTYIAAPQVSPRTTILYPTQVRPGSINSTYGQNDQYTPLPRADIKPYHESYFHDIKPPVPLDSESRCNFVPEGLAASLQARVLNGPQIKEEVDTYERRTYIQNGVSVYHQEQAPGHIKTETISNDCQYKRESPVIQGPIRTVMRRTSVYLNDGQRNPSENNQSPESHSNTSTPLVDEVQESCRQRKLHEEDVEVEEEAEESKWQDRISSGFDRLVAFASTELDKRRRSTEGTDSCNTSPDSGIGHGDPSPATITVPPNKALKLNPNSKPTLFKMPSNKNKNLESPPILDQNDECGPPRTPSPSSTPNLSIAYSPELSITNEKSPNRNPALLKYQRHVEDKKTKPDQHFKKKFYYREQWRDDNWQKANEEYNAEPIRDKFKPKGKDWNWPKVQMSDIEKTQTVHDEWNQPVDKYEWKN